MYRPPLVLLHAALGSAAQLEPLARELAPHFDVLTLDFEGHGAAGPSGRPMDYAHMAGNVTALLDRRGIGAAPVFGHSMGGYVGLYLCVHAPERVTALHTLGTFIDWSPELGERMCAGLDPERITEKVPAFARSLDERHASVDWRGLARATSDLIRRTAAAPALDRTAFARVMQPVRVGIGECDEMMTVAQAESFAAALPRGELSVFENAGHAIEKVPLAALAHSITEFVAGTAEAALRDTL